MHHAFTVGQRAAPGDPPGADRRSCCAASTTARCASTSTGSSTCRRPACPAPAPTATPPTSPSCSDCWDQEGRVDEAGTIVYRHLTGGGDPAQAIAALGHALLTEDAEFHWFQTYEAAVRQFHAWPAGSEEGALILAGTARFLAAHTPTRRELSQVVRIATRLGRGEALFEES